MQPVTLWSRKLTDEQNASTYSSARPLAQLLMIWRMVLMQLLRVVLTVVMRQLLRALRILTTVLMQLLRVAELHL